MKNPIQREYQNSIKLYEEFAESLVRDLKEVLKYPDLNIQLINKRLKDPTSLILKFQSKEKYKSLNDITDIVGIRVVTTYLSEVPYICRQIEKKFNIDKENTNKNEPENESEFGYSSIHYIVKGAKGDNFLSKNEKFSGLIAEIQVRTLLQHAWAETSHKIDYKSEKSVSKKHKRKLFRISALLELADQEFYYLRKGTVKSQKEIIPPGLNDYRDLPINEENLLAFILESDICNILDKKIADFSNNNIHFNRESIIDKNLNHVKNLGLKSIGELNKTLREKSIEIIECYKEQNLTWDEFMTAFPEKHGNGSSPRGISITYLYFSQYGKYD